MDQTDAISRLERRLERERQARTQAEAIAEQGLLDLYRNQRQAELLERVASAAIEGHALEMVLTIALSGICELCNWPLGHMFLVDHGALQTSGIWCGGDKAALKAMRATTPQLDAIAPTHLPGRVLAHARPAWIEDLQTDQDFVRQQAARAHGLHGAAAFPQLLRGRVVGVAEFFAYEGLAPDEAKTGLITSILQKIVVVVERQQVEARLRAGKAQLDTALANMSHGLCMYDATRRLRLFNRRFADIYGLAALHTQQTLEEVLLAQIQAGTAPHDIARFQRERLEIGAVPAPAYIVEALSDGRVIGISSQPMQDGGWMETHEDITEHRRTQDRLIRMAHYDGLTDLPNRLLFHDRLSHALAQASRHGGDVALLCLDLDRFKEVNDTLGHKVGDDLLCNVAARLRACVRKSDTIARLGGDEFAIIQAGMPEPSAAMTLATRLLQELSMPYDLHGHRVVMVSASIGIALSPRDGQDADTLLRAADLAMYEAKTAG